MGDEMRRLLCPPDVASLVPEALAREFEIFPLEDSGGTMTVAVGAPLAEEALDTIRFVLGRDIREVLHPAAVIRVSLDELYGVRVEQEESIYYWRKWRNILDDGTIIMKARGYDRSGAHWTGWAEITPDHHDFGLWTWVLTREDRFDEIISGKVLESIREECQRNA